MGTEGSTMSFIINIISLVFTMIRGWFSILGDIGIDGIADLFSGVM